MGFLDQLRMSNVFPKKGDRPMGMPEIDDGDIGDTLNTVLPFAKRSNDEDMRRSKEMMRYGQELKMQSAAPQLSITDRAYGRTQPLQPGQMNNGMMGGSVPGGRGSNSGFSPMQEMFQKRDIADRARQQEQSDMTTKFNQAMSLQGLRGDQDIDLEGVRSASNAADIEQRGGIDRRAAALLAENQRSAAGVKNTADIEAAKVRQAGEMEQGAQRGYQDRWTQSQKPPVGAAANDPTKQFAHRAQELAMAAPDLAKMLVPPAEGGSFTISPDATPDQIVAIRRYMLNQQQAAQDGRPQASPGQPRKPVPTRRKGASPLRNAG